VSSRPTRSAVEAKAGSSLVAYNGRLRGSKKAAALQLATSWATSVPGAPCTRRCTLLVTGQCTVNQPMYHCLTCAVVGAAALCAVCAETCHRGAGHSVVFFCVGEGYCDCSHAAFDTCKCLPAKVDEAGTTKEYM
jgi:hypothetical protein